MTDGKPDTKPSERLQELIKTLARQHEYPPTPDVAGEVLDRMSRPRGGLTRIPTKARLATVLAALVLVVMAVPPVRAAVFEPIWVGAVRLLSGESGPAPGATPIPQLSGLAGATSLEEARASVGFVIPTPPDWPTPDYVFLQDLEGVPAVVLVWLDERDPENIELSLHLIGSSEIPLIEKLNIRYLEETEVDGWPAVWIEGPHVYQHSSGGTTFERLVEGNVLLWTDEGVTYRLETTHSQAEALAIAESLR
jgi:hypothetical protein